MRHTVSIDDKVQREGFPIPDRKRSTLRTTDDYLEYEDEVVDDLDTRVYNQYRSFRNSHTYGEYAKDICINYAYDLRRYQLCVAQKKLIGFMTKNDFEALKEDLIFLRDCWKTILAEYNDFFKARFVDATSIRAYAAEHNINRGSVEYIQKKLFGILSDALEQRDKADGKRRILPERKRTNNWILFCKAPVLNRAGAFFMPSFKWLWQY